jgi:alanine racemase
MARPARATIDLQALAHNAGVARSLAPRSRLMAVVKANAYGHGAVAVARTLQDHADALAVACLEEALELRESGISAPILLLEGAFEPAEYPLAAEQDLWLTIENLRQLDWLEAASLPRPLHCWLKVDTGMNRLGVAPESVPRCLQRLAACAGEGTVLFTHLSSADNPQSAQTGRQLDAFEALSLPPDTPRSAANSAAVIAWPRAHYDWIRPGYMLYGASPMDEPVANEEALQAVMTLRSAIISLRDVGAGEPVGYGGTWVAPRPSRIATVAIGYGDGYPRQAPNGTPVLVNGERAPLAGRVSMDMITLDVTDLPRVQAGDEVVLWGADLPLRDIARCAGTIGYELTTRMPLRTVREYYQGVDGAG